MKHKNIFLPSNKHTFVFMNQTLKQKTAYGIFWNFLDKFGQNGLSLIIWVIIARYFLFPPDYALVGMILIVNGLGNILSDSGFSNALIRKQNVTQTDLSSVFYFNIIISISLYVLIFFCAPLLALYFNQPVLTSLVRVMALCIPINALAFVQNTTLTKAMNFKFLACTNLVAFFCSATVSLWLAWKGFGVWVLVINPLAFSVVRNISLWCFNRWRPIAVFSIDSIKELWSYSSKLLLSSIIIVVFKDIYAFFMGKIYPLEAFGYYTQANKYSELPYVTIMSAIQTVVYPAMANIGAHNNEELKKSLRKTVRVSSFVLLPVMLGLIATAEPLIHTLLSAKWLPVAPYLQILSVGYIFIGITTTYNNILFVKGLSSTFLKFNILYRAGILLSIVITMYSGITAMITAWSIVAILYAISLMVYVGKKIEYHFMEQIKDILPYFVLALFMGVGVYLFSFLIQYHVTLVSVQVVVGAAFYLGASYLLGSKVFREAIEMIRSKAGKVG
jgi:O-antigen/teichoic acid export membrane protein